MSDLITGDAGLDRGVVDNVSAQRTGHFEGHCALFQNTLRRECYRAPFVFPESTGGEDRSRQLPATRTTAASRLLITIVLHLVIMRMLHKHAANAGGCHASLASNTLAVRHARPRRPRRTRP